MSVPVQAMAANLQMLQAAYAGKTIQAFVYNMVFPNVAAAAATVATAQLQIQNDSDFLIVEQSFSVNDTVTTLDVASSPLIQLTDQGSGQTMFNVAMPAPNIFGTAQLPLMLPVPRLLSKNSTLTGSLTTRTTANISTYTFSFIGFKIWG